MIESYSVFQNVIIDRIFPSYMNILIYNHVYDQWLFNSFVLVMTVHLDIGKTIIIHFNIISTNLQKLLYFQYSLMNVINFLM